VDLRVISAFTSTHHGVITRDVARRLGLSEDAWYRAVSTGPLEYVHPKVARVRGAPVTREQRVLAAVWACGDGAMASHRSAAHLWGARRPNSDPIDVIVDRRTVSARITGVVVHHPRDLAELRPVVRRGIATTTPMRMLLDLGAVDGRGVPSALDDILRSRIVSHRAVAEFVARHRKRGRHGTRALVAALDARTIDGDSIDSVLEHRMATLVRRHSLPPVEFHAICAGYEVDFLVVGTNIVLECDGWATHGADREQFEFDRERDHDLIAAGFLVLHFTWTQVTRNPARVAHRIAAAVQTWSSVA
jgi:very-short-patch-repair endonuclease